MNWRKVKDGFVILMYWSASTAILYYLFFKFEAILKLI